MTAITAADAAFDVERVRGDFPILRSTAHGHPLVYLDSGATAQKPQVVIDTVRDFYAHDNANIHRGVYQLSERATLAWDEARDTVAHFLGGTASESVVFTRGTTESINLVAQCFVRPRLAKNPRVIVTEMEHHANIVPWQLVGATTLPIRVSDDGDLDLDHARQLLSEGAVMLAVTHVSNVLGTINPIAELCRMARDRGVPVLVDGAQAAPHLPIDVEALGCDFYTFSSHKTYGPTGIGVLWARDEHLRSMPPYQGGGDMIDLVTFERTTFAPPPRKFEAGTPHIAGAIGFAAALRWLMALDRDAMHAHEQVLVSHVMSALGEIEGLRLIGTPREKGPVVAFDLAGVHPHDIASLLDGDGVCVRAGHHCAQPLHRRLGLTATTRASFGPYTNHADIGALVRGLHRVREIFPA